MQKITCYECKKSYNYQDEAFCPHCGAFNQSPRSTYITADGSVARVDGLSEVGHEGSFLHQEFHDEERSRRKSGLAKGVQRIPTPPAFRRADPEKQSPQQKSGKQATKGLAGIISWIVFAIILFNILGPLLLRSF